MAILPLLAQQRCKGGALAMVVLVSSWMQTRPIALFLASSILDLGGWILISKGSRVRA